MRHVGPFALVLAFAAGCGQKPAPQPIDNSPAPAGPEPADGPIPPPRPLLREHSPDHAFEGRKLFLKLQCVKCHAAEGGKGPNLEGVYGTTAELKGGTTTLADDWYLVESIRNPRAKVVAGWEPVMPAYGAEQLTAEELSAVIAYLRSIGKGAADGNAPPVPVGAPTDRPTGK